MKIFLSAGHRGKGTGAVGIIDEGSETIILRDAIAAHMTSPNVVVVRDNNAASLSSVVASINQQSTSKDISLDIHFNASSNSSANGCEVLVSQYASESTIKMAKGLLDTCVGVLGIKSRGVKKENAGQHSKLAMLSGVKPKAMLLEVCFVGNSEDVRKYRLKKDGLAKSIANYLLTIQC